MVQDLHWQSVPSRVCKYDIRSEKNIQQLGFLQVAGNNILAASFGSKIGPWSNIAVTFWHLSPNVITSCLCVDTLDFVSSIDYAAYCSKVTDPP
jgi:hypothetical protein